MPPLLDSQKLAGVRRPWGATKLLAVTVDNDSRQNAVVTVATEIFPLDANGRKGRTAATRIAAVNLQVSPHASAPTEGAGTVANPRLWGPPPQQRPNRYVAVTSVTQGSHVVDIYETRFGIRTIRFEPDQGFFINGEPLRLNGVCNHHDLGALGVALNRRALQRQLEMLADMGCNALCTSHNPPAPELLELADEMGFLVMDEAFDVWARQKTPLDFHLIFPAWPEADLRAQIRRDRNCPSVILWSIGNEVGEQYTGTNGAGVAKELGEFVWTAWDYLGEPTPFEASRSSYAGIIDLAGFKKDRFYLYQAHWRPDFPMAHILPHWTWPERVGQVTPVHVFTSGDEGELFLNGQTLGRKKKAEHEYRLRWDEVVYHPGTLKVVAYKKGRPWATDEVETAGEPAGLRLEPDRNAIKADGRDLPFVTVTVVDQHGVVAPRADNRVHFDLEGPGEIVVTDNGDPTSFESFHTRDRKTFNGLGLVIVRGNSAQPGSLRLTARADGLRGGTVFIRTFLKTEQAR